MLKIDLDGIEVNCESIQDLKDAITRKVAEGEKKLEKIEEEERILRRDIRKLQTYLAGKPAKKQPGAVAASGV